MSTYFHYLAATQSIEAFQTAGGLLSLAGKILVSIALGIVLIAVFVAWLVALVEICNHGYWTWFLALIFFPVIGLPLYYWFGPETTKRAT